MNPIQKRFLLFLLGCIPVRTLFAYIAAKISTDNLPYLGMLALIPIIGWINIMFFNPRDTGLETGGEEIWWKHLRKVHLTFYILFAVSAFSKWEGAWMFLALDVMFGLVSFLDFHCNEGNFEKL